MDKQIESLPKILCVSVMQNWGGGEEFLLKLCANVKDYEFMIASPGGDALNKYKEKKIKTATINSLKKIYRGSGWNLISFLRMIFNIKISTLRLLKTFKAENPTIVLANGLFAALYSLPSIAFTKKKLIVVQHLIFNKDSIEKKVIKFIYKIADKIVCVSNAVKENVLLMLNMQDSYKIIVIPNGIILPNSNCSDKSVRDKTKIGIVGNIIRIKGIHLVIDALKDILTNENTSLHIFGTVANDSDSLRYESELKDLIKKSGLEEKVHFEGYTESKEKIYSFLDIIISYSIIPEAFPYSILEAMSYKKIIIATEAGGIKEMIDNGENGFLTKPDDVNLLKEKIKFCIENIRTEAFDHIREKAFAKVKDEYSIERFSMNYNNFFNSLKT